MKFSYDVRQNIPVPLCTGRPAGGSSDTSALRIGPQPGDEVPGTSYETSIYFLWILIGRRVEKFPRFFPFWMNRRSGIA